MNIFDKILASGYYVFENELNSHIIRNFITLARKSGKKFERDELKMDEISKYMEFDNHIYRLKKGYTINDISDFIDLDIITIFHNYKIYRDRYYSGKYNKNEPTFANLVKKIKRY